MSAGRLPAPGGVVGPGDALTDAPAVRGTRICVRCVMDTSDPEIVFDERGVCSHCRLYDDAVARDPYRDPGARRRALDAWIERIRRAGRGRPYDCVIGVSGGVDSSFVAWQVKELGLRPLAVHLDNGWDAELAVHNVQKLVQALAIDLETHVLDWDEFRDLQLAFLRASTPDSEVPSDHAIAVTVYRAAWKHRIPHVVLGHNRATEMILPPAWSQGRLDWHYIRAVHRRYGTRPLKTFPLFDPVSHARFFAWNRARTLQILDLVDYDKRAAIDLLKTRLGWEYYGGKHYESVYTRFFQGYILPVKFGYDKRRAHLSSLVCSGQISRDEALAEMTTDPYPSETMKQSDKEYVIKKLGLTPAEFEAIMRLPPRAYGDFPSLYATRLFRAARWVFRRARGLGLAGGAGR